MYYVVQASHQEYYPYTIVVLVGLQSEAGYLDFRCDASSSWQISPMNQPEINTSIHGTIVLSTSTTS